MRRSTVRAVLQCWIMTTVVGLAVGVAVMGCGSKGGTSGGGTTGAGGAAGSDAGGGAAGTTPDDGSAVDVAPSYFTASYHMGADITWVQHDEYYGATYVDTDGVPKDILVLLKKHGFNS